MKLDQTEGTEDRLPTIEDFYTGEEYKKNGKIYKVVDYKKAIKLFDSGEYLYGKKVAPTNIRKAIAGEKIITYSENSNEEGCQIAREGDVILQNLNNKKDIYIQPKKILEEFSSGKEGVKIEDLITSEFKPFIKKSPPSKILVGIVEEPIVLIIKEWSDENGPYKQYLEKGATLKLDKDKVTGINKSGFEAWDIVDSETDSENKSFLLKIKNVFRCINGHKFYYDTGSRRRICKDCGYTEVGTYDLLSPNWDKK